MNLFVQENLQQIFPTLPFYDEEDYLTHIKKLSLPEQLQLWYQLSENKNIHFDDILNLFKKIEKDYNCILHDNNSMNSILFNSFMMPYQNIMSQQVYSQLSPYIKKITDFDWDLFYIRGKKPLKYMSFFEIFMDRKPIKEWFDSIVQYRKNNSYDITTPITVMAHNIYKTLNNEKFKEFFDNIDLCPQEEKETLLDVIVEKCINDIKKSIEEKKDIIEQLLKKMSVLSKEKLFFKALTVKDGTQILECIKKENTDTIQNLFLKMIDHDKHPQYLYINNIMIQDYRLFSHIEKDSYQFLLENNAPKELFNYLIFYTCSLLCTSINSNYQNITDIVCYIDGQNSNLQKLDMALLALLLEVVVDDNDSFMKFFSYLVECRKEHISSIKTTIEEGNIEQIASIQNSETGQLYINYETFISANTKNNIVSMLNKVLLNEKLLKDTKNHDIKQTNQHKI